MPIYNNSPKKKMIYNLLKGIETGDPESVKVVNEEKYIQHNPQTREGGEGLAELFSRLSKTNPKVEIIRLFEDGDFVFGHTIYDFSSVRIGFEVFRYEGDQVVEHWDNIQSRIGDMVAGPTTALNLENTEMNRLIIRNLINHVFIEKKFELYHNFVHRESYIERSTSFDLYEKMKKTDYRKSHRVLAEGNFVLSISEGLENERVISYYDLFRLSEGKVSEHWDTTEKVPPIYEWKNGNGKF